MDYAALILEHLSKHNCDLKNVQVDQVGNKLIIGLDGLKFGFIKVEITGEYMDELTYLYEAVDLIIDQAIIGDALFTKSRKTFIEQRGITITSTSKYEFKLLVSEPSGNDHIKVIS